MLTYCDAHLAGDDHPGWDAPYPHTAGHTRVEPSTGRVLQFIPLLPPANRTGGHQEPLVVVRAAIIGVDVGGGEVWCCEVHVKVSQLSTFHFDAEMQDGSLNIYFSDFNNFKDLNI